MPTPPPNVSDLTGRLERLAALQQQGILTPEELVAQKAEILTGRGDFPAGSIRSNERNTTWQR